MNELKKNKGFTLIELLATIVIIGVLATISIIGINKIINNSKTSYYKSQKNMIVLAAKTYFSDHRDELPSLVDTTNTISLKTLIAGKYIDPVKDAEGNVCDNENTIVTVSKITNVKYEYNVYLTCNNFKENYIPSVEDPEIIFDPNSGIDINRVSMTIKNSRNYQYTIYKTDNLLSVNKAEFHATAAPTKGTTSYSGESVDITLQGVGKYYIVGKSGNVTKDSEYYIINKTDSGDGECNDSSLKYNINNATQTWSNTPLKMSIDYTKANDIKYYEVYYSQDKEDYKLLTTKNNDKANTITYKNDGKTSFMVKFYNSSNEEYCQKNLGEYYLDMKNPTISLKESNPIANEYGWHKTGFSVDLTASDDLAGIAYYQYKYKNGNWITYANSNSTDFTTPQFTKERNENAYFRACDYAGNCSDSVTTPIKIDKTAPLAPKVTNKYDNIWFNQNYSVNLKSSDDLSGIKEYAYSYTMNADDWHPYSNSAKTSYNTTDFVWERNQNAYFNVCDNAGNCSGFSWTNIKIDKTPPEYTLIAAYCGDPWHKNDVGYMQINFHDNLSGIARRIAKSWDSGREYTNDSNFDGQSHCEDTISTGDVWMGYSHTIWDVAGNKNSNANPQVKFNNCG